EYDRALSAADPRAPRASTIAVASTLGEMGRAEAAGPLLSALSSAKDDLTRAQVARAMTKIPARPETKKAFVAAFDKIGTTMTLPSNAQNARATLLEAAALFFDPELVPWILRQVTSPKG